MTTNRWINSVGRLNICIIIIVSVVAIFGIINLVNAHACDFGLGEWKYDYSKINFIPCQRDTGSYELFGLNPDGINWSKSFRENCEEHDGHELPNRATIEVFCEVYHA